MDTGSALHFRVTLVDCHTADIVMAFIVLSDVQHVDL